MENVDVVGEASNGLDAIKKAQELHPDLIIMDVSMPILDGLRAAEFIKKHYPEIKILMMSLHKFSALIKQAKDLDLAGYILKDEIRPALGGALEAVIHGDTFYPHAGSAQSL